MEGTSTVDTVTARLEKRAVVVRADCRYHKASLFTRRGIALNTLAAPLPTSRICKQAVSRTPPASKDQPNWREYEPANGPHPGTMSMPMRLLCFGGGIKWALVQGGGEKGYGKVWGVGGGGAGKVVGQPGCQSGRVTHTVGWRVAGPVNATA